MKSVSLPLIGVLLVLAAAPAPAQYPNRPVRLVSPVSAGSGADTLARIVGQGIARDLGQPVVVENKPGAEGAIAARAVATAPGDGYTLLFGGISTYVLPFTVTPAPFEAGDLAPAGTVGQITYGLFVHPSIPARTLPEFLAHARANPGKLAFASVNVATDLGAAHLMKAAGIEMLKVPYKGGAQVFADLVAGRIQVYFGPVASGLPFVKEGRLAIVACHPQRSPMAPGVPSLAEEGLRIAFRPLHYMLLVPSRTPPQTVERLGRALNASLESPEVRAQLEGQGVQVDPSSPQRAAALVAEGIAMWSAFLREAGPRE